MEGKNSSSSSRVQEIQVAPFVLKTYEMVADPTTDGVIRWGRGNNSFLVVNPTLFSNFLLPSYFKHNNFSSFVRQLNTYGFRKVEADRWEFAHESFLRGQTHLLPLVVRRKKSEPETAAAAEEEAAAAAILREVGILRREQQSLEREVQEMSKRLSVTERRPQRMISFLSKVADDPNFLRRLVTSKKLAAAKKQRVPIPPPPPIEIGALFLLEDKAGMLTISGERPFPTAVDAGTSGGGDPPPALCEEIPPEFGGSTAAASVYPFCLLGHDFF